MKTFSTGIADNLALVTGTTPVFILRLTVNGVEYFLSDHAFTVPNWGAFGTVAVKAWVANWGQLQEGITGAINEQLVADYTVSLAVVESEPTNARDLALTYELEKNPAELFFWFEDIAVNGLSDVPALLFRGFVKEVSIPDMKEVTLLIEDETSRFQKYLGHLVTSEEFTNCDPDDVGKMIPISYGTVNKVPAVCVESGLVSSLALDMTNSATTMTLTDAFSGSLLGKSFYINDELVTVTTPPALTTSDYASVGKGATLVTSGSVVMNGISYLNDGSRDTYTMCNGAFAAGYTQTFEITFQSPKTINRINMINELSLHYPNMVANVTSDPARGSTAKAFTISVWNGSAWVTVYTATNNTFIWVQANFTPVVASKIRVVVTSILIPTWSLMINAIEALNTNEANEVQTNPKVLTVLRGQQSTTAVDHVKGALVVEKKSTPLVYIINDRPLDAINTIYARFQGVDVDITLDCIKYLGTPSNQLSAYAGRACFTIADFAKVASKVTIALQNTLGVSQGNHTHPTGTNIQTVTMNTYVYESGLWAQSIANGTLPTSSAYCANAIDGDYATCARPMDIHGNKFRVKKTTAVTGSANPLFIRAVVFYGGQISEYPLGVANIYVKGVLVASMALPADSSTSIRHESGWFAISAWTDIYSGDNTYIQFDVRSASIGIYEAFWEVQTGTPISYSAASGVALTGAINLSGNSISNLMIGDALLADVVNNITAPAAVVGDILNTYFNDNTLAVVGSMPASYSFNGALTEYRKAADWLDLLAFQCRSYFRKSCGVSRLFVREVNPTSTTTIVACALDNEGLKKVSYKKAPSSDVINKIRIMYDRDYMLNAADPKAYNKSVINTDAASIAIYGEQERPELFLFGFVTSTTMANDLLTFYHDIYSSRKWRITFEAFLDCLSTEFGDPVTLGFINDAVGYIAEAALEPNNLGKIKFTVETRSIPVIPANAIVTSSGHWIVTKSKTGGREGLIAD